MKRRELPRPKHRSHRQNKSPAPSRHPKRLQYKFRASRRPPAPGPVDLCLLSVFYIFCSSLPPIHSLPFIYNIRLNPLNASKKAGAASATSHFSSLMPFVLQPFYPCPDILFQDIRCSLDPQPTAVDTDIVISRIAPSSLAVRIMIGFSSPVLARHHRLGIRL